MGLVGLKDWGFGYIGGLGGGNGVGLSGGFGIFPG